jgi:PhnB protein
MATLNPYIGFNGKTREAMTFYKEIFGGSLELNEVGGSPMEQHWPSGAKDAIFHSVLSTGKLIIMATDMSGPGGLVLGNNISMALGCETEAEITELYNKLSEGGEILDTLKKQFWGALFATVKDKFGIVWMMNCDTTN